ncbi:MAG: hypothetical protein JW774_06075, partial [Candidatus Aureabacteria bacterium]|nr:hypothetical protein [Candidatus Auribacterota bacterium]
MTPSSKQKHILCILKPSPLFDPHHAMLTDEGYFVYHQENTSKALGQIYYEPPDMILLSAESTDWKSIISKLKDDPVYCHLPLILILSRTLEIPLASVSDFKPDDFFFIEDHPQELLLRIRIRETQTSRTLDTNPLTRLPGNHSIMAAIQNHIDEQKEFAL